MKWEAGQDRKSPPAAPVEASRRMVPCRAHLEDGEETRKDDLVESSLSHLLPRCGGRLEGCPHWTGVLGLCHVGATNGRRYKALLHGCERRGHFQQERHHQRGGEIAAPPKDVVECCNGCFREALRPPRHKWTRALLKDPLVNENQAVAQQCLTGSFQSCVNTDCNAPRMASVQWYALTDRHSNATSLHNRTTVGFSILRATCDRAPPKSLSETQGKCLLQRWIA